MTPEVQSALSSPYAPKGLARMIKRLKRNNGTLTVITAPFAPRGDQFTFSIDGARSIVEATSEELAWAKARRITGDNASKLRRLNG